MPYHPLKHVTKMNRTRLPKNFTIKDKNLILRLSWSFHHTTGVDLEELISESIVAYCEAQLKWDCNKGTKFSTWAYSCITNALIHFTKVETRYIFPDTDAPFSRTINQTHWFEFFDALPKECQEMASIILKEKNELAGLPPKLARGVLISILRKQGWAWSKIWERLRMMQQTLSNIPTNPSLKQT